MRRKKRYDKFDYKRAGIFTCRKPFHYAGRSFPVKPYDRENRSQLNEHLKDLCLFVIETEKVAGKDQVTRG